MAHPDFVFPQHGDEPDAAYFAYWMGQRDLAGFVETGFDFTVDWADETFDMTSGKAFLIREEMQTASPDIDMQTMEEVLMVVGKAEEQNVGIIAGEPFNWVYLDPRYEHTDSPRLRVIDDRDAAETEWLGLARLNVQTQTVAPLNRFRPETDLTSPLSGSIRRQLMPGEELVIEEDESMIVLDYFDEGTGDFTVKGDFLIREFEEETIGRIEFDEMVEDLETQIADSKSDVESQLQAHVDQTQAHGSDGDVVGQNTLDSEVDTLQTQIDDHDTRLDDAESRLDSAESRLDTAESDISTIQTTLDDHEQRISDLEEDEE